MTSSAPDTPRPSVCPATFRVIMASFASGVCVVTTLDEYARPRGFTCSAFCSVSVDPPLLLSSVSSQSSTLTAVRDCGRFAVNMLGRHARDVSALFASAVDDRFDRVAWAPGPAAGMPLLADTVADAECELTDLVSVGDHTLMIGRVVGGGVRSERSPLAYWRGGYAEVLPAGPAGRR
ncbi:flavin reductase family protein [Micromonospora sp. WMMD723]|uniref:flavin reductase family protein n=1 Tax=unclassified Micromonospora TaxID=2617518 RepID=UPI003B955717